jgi:hypothetical protein
MKVLKCLIDNPNGITRRDAVKTVYGRDLRNESNGWNCGPFTLLRENNYADYFAKTKKWHATQRGLDFYCKTIENSKVSEC